MLGFTGLSAVAAVLVLTGCGAVHGKGTPERVVEEAFAAIRANDWERYEKLTITLADFTMRDHGPKNIFARGQSYAALLRKEMKQGQRAEFDRAVLVLRDERFEQARALDSDRVLLLDGDEIPSWKFAPMPSNNPRFKLLSWAPAKGSAAEYRICWLEFEPSRQRQR